MSEKGPVYGVELIGDLPLGTSAMFQAMPDRSDLEQVRKVNERVAAGYEVLLWHYRKLESDLAAAKAASAVPDFLICLDCVRVEDAPFEVGDACLCGGIFVEAVSIANWLRDRMKERGDPV